jgi:hypothetical protein
MVGGRPLGGITLRGGIPRIPAASRLHERDLCTGNAGSPALGDAIAERHSHDPLVTLASGPGLARPAAWAAEVSGIRRRLLADFTDLPAAVVEHVLEVEVLRFVGSRATSFVPILIDRNARAWLRQLRQER